MTTRTTERERFLADIIICAVEGGTGYWAQVSDYHWSDEEPGTTRATLWDMEEPEVPLELNIDVVAKGIRAILDDTIGLRSDLVEAFALANRENDATEIDAEGADVIVQAALFGDVVYG